VGVNTSSQLVAAVDLGTAKTSVLIGQVTDMGQVDLVGFGTGPSEGIVKGVVRDLPAASEALHRVWVEAERVAGVTVRNAVLAVSGAHLAAAWNDGTVSVAGVDQIVSPPDMQLVRRLACAREIPAGRIVVNQEWGTFWVDGRAVGPMPIGLRGDKLSVDCWTLHGDEAIVRNAFNLVGGLGLTITDLVHAGLASASVVTSPVDREHGCIVVDIGAGTTDYVWYWRGQVVMAGTLALGGDQLTGDVAVGLRLTEDLAEKAKMRFGRASVVRSKGDMGWIIKFTARVLGASAKKTKYGIPKAINQSE